jgi:tRNA threonylcarbamoyladenosine biosynthesis protein TsaB
VAQDALDLDPGADAVLVCNDARMHEVYWAGFLRDAGGLAIAASPERVGPAAAVVVAPALQGRAVAGAGRGFAVYPELARRLGLPRALQPTLLPSAAAVARLAVPEWLAGRSVAPGAALPIYVRDDVARPAGPG